MNESLRCESCAAPIAEDGREIAYDRSTDGQGRTRLIALCDPCWIEYILELWTIASPVDPARIGARVLAGRDTTEAA